MNSYVFLEALDWHLITKSADLEKSLMDQKLNLERKFCTEMAWWKMTLVWVTINFPYQTPTQQDPNLANKESYLTLKWKYSQQEEARNRKWLTNPHDIRRHVWAANDEQQQLEYP